MTNEPTFRRIRKSDSNTCMQCDEEGAGIQEVNTDSHFCSPACVEKWHGGKWTLILSSVDSTTGKLFTVTH